MVDKVPLLNGLINTIKGTNSKEEHQFEGGG